MTGIVFYFEENDTDIYSGRLEDLHAWNYACKIGGIDKAIIINKTNLELTTFDSSMDIKIVKQMPQVSGRTCQVVCPWENTPTGKIELWNFPHKVDWYFFGPASGWVNNFFAKSYLTLPQNGKGSTHATHIATTVMFHRFNVIK